MNLSLNIEQINVLDEFKSFCASIGLLLSEVIADGRKHRVKTLDDKTGQKSGEYKLYLDGWPAGYATNFRFPDLGGKWKLPFTSQKTYSMPNIEEINRKIEERKKMQDALFKKRSFEACKFLGQLENNSSQKTYLDRKRVCNVPNIKFKNDVIFVPYRNIDNHLTTFQQISYDGKKRFFADAKKHGSFFQIMKFSTDYSGLIFIGEGIATMLSVYMATGCPVVVAGDVGNITPVLEAFKSRYQNARIIICADHDEAGLKNVSVWKNKFNVSVKFPPTKGMDFNDVHIEHGLNEILNILKGY